MQLLAKGSSTSPDEATKKWSLDFLLSPHSLHSSPESPFRLSHVKFNRTALDPSNPFSPSAQVTPKILTSGQPAQVDLPANIFFRSVGYKSMPLPGFEALGIQFDQRRGIVPNDGFGRVTSAAEPAEDRKSPDGGPVFHLPGLYCAGWVKRGPTGVIASTMADAFSTADTMAADWEARKMSFLNASSGGSTGLGWDGVRPEAEQRGLRPTSWQDWLRIDAVEKERGSKKGKPREKFGRVEEMLEVIA
ncbi:hypothetical protein VTN02DRAFT_3985 [Thermoascus thermophilus]